MLFSGVTLPHQTPAAMSKMFAVADKKKCVIISTVVALVRLVTVPNWFPGDVPSLIGGKTASGHRVFKASTNNY